MKIISFLFLLALSSCASFHDGKKYHQSSFGPNHLEVNGTVEVDINHRYMYLNGSLEDTVGHSPYMWSSPKEVKSFKLCKAKPCKEIPDRTILIDLYYGKTESLFTLLSFLTLTVIPSKEAEKFVAVAVVLDEEKRVRGKYILNDQIATWYQILFLFGLPFQDFKMRDKLMNDLVNEILWRAKSDNVI